MIVCAQRARFDSLQYDALSCKTSLCENEGNELLLHTKYRRVVLQVVISGRSLHVSIEIRSLVL